MSKHTPRPWAVTTNALHPHPHSAFQIFQVGAKLSSGRIAHIPASESKPTEANAWLIAAAPDLLLACERALQVIEEDRECFVDAASYKKIIDPEAQHIVDGYDAAIGILTHAIAKAQGGAK
jgi:hypothetical protein